MRTRALTDAARDALRLGKGDLAETLCRQALAEDETDRVAWTFLGAALRHRDCALAEAALRRAIDGPEPNADAQFHLGNLLREEGRYAEAIALYRAALSRVPDHSSVLNNLGLSLAAVDEHDAAERAYRAVLAREPGHRYAMTNLLHLLCKRQRYREAAGIGDRYLRANTEAPVGFWIDYGIARHAQTDFDAAAACFRRAVQLAPRDPAALANLGTVLSDMGKFVDAERAIAAANAAAPHDLRVLALLAHCRAHLCRWLDLEALHAEIAEVLASEPRSGINPFQALSMPLTAAAQLQNARWWAASVLPALPPAPAIVGSRGDRLRVGYVSSDFREHALAFLATEVWERHDRARFATFGYAIGVPDDSPMRRRIRGAFATFRDCHADTAEAIARQIRRDGIDVLVDLNGYTAHAQSGIFASRPAPVQVQWLGYLGTMGAPWIDYIVTDRYVTTGDDQRHFDEAFLYLPDCYCPSDTRRPVAETIPGRAACALPEQGFVFCCFNNPYKLLPAVFDVWMRLLRRIPGSVLWLSPCSIVAMENLSREAIARGVAPTRIVFAPRVPIAQHLARHAHADLYLDTTPYNAGAAANDALFMGAPVLTCSGQTMASRVAGSQLRAIGMPMLVTHKLQAYEECAITLAKDRAELQGIRRQLAINRQSHPLFDMARFTNALEAALVAAADRGERDRSKPKPLDVECGNGLTSPDG
ncbi:MAG: tetratricopeptide repeat protein [Burkholderiales bacterium]